MYCPKCGGQNSDDLAYCRHCGENLKIISQAMERTFPHVIASKVVAAIEKKNGRLMRAAVTTGIFGILYSAWNFLTPIDPYSLSAGFPFLRFVLPGFWLLMSVYYILTYRRALEVEGRTAGVAGGDHDSSSVFCTNCRTVNDSAHRFCHSCGNDMATRPSGLARFLPSFILRILDGGLSRNEAVFKSPRSRLGIAITTIAAFAFAGYFAFIGAWWMTILMGFAGLQNIITNGWDNLTHSRHKDSRLGTQTRELSSNETAALDSHLDETRRLAAGDEFRRSNVRDTVRFATPPGSVKEDTTKHLTTLAEPSPEEPLSTSELKNN